MKPLSFYLFLLGVGILCGGTARAQQMRPGQWEVTTRTEMAGMPMRMPDRIASLCVSGQNDDAPPIANDGTCTFSNYRRTGSSAVWQMACSGMANMTGEGRIDFAGDSYQGGAVMNMMMGPGQSMQMRMTFTGRRMGNC